MITILSQRLPSLELLTLADFPGSPEPDETGSTYQENAWIKARSAMAFTGLPSLADDAGLEIDALDGAPGLYSKRFGGEDLPFPEKDGPHPRPIEGSPRNRLRTARFRCVIASPYPKARRWSSSRRPARGASGSSRAERGGFGYDPIFYLPETQLHDGGSVRRREAPDQPSWEGASGLQRLVVDVAARHVSG